MSNPLLPVTDKSIDLSLLHPRFVQRLEDFFSDGRIGNRVSICSGCRSYAAQKALYDRYKRGKGNLAANPDWKRPDGFFRGSFHQEQPDGYSYAVDLRIVKRGIATDKVAAIAARYGVRRAGERTHLSSSQFGPEPPGDRAAAPVTRPHISVFKDHTTNTLSSPPTPFPRPPSRGSASACTARAARRSPSRAADS